ncbi:MULTISPECIES: hypothetical protein [unclassified Janthinobacterium]|nr:MULTISPECIES: hypothetical protein [unclassified Janthinobacterium]
MKTLIIAEAGVNHHGDLELAKQFILPRLRAHRRLSKCQNY